MLGENEKDLIKIIEILKGLLNNKKYEAEYKVINSILLYLNEMNLDNIDINKLKEYKNIINDLEMKYDDIFDLSYYYEPLYIKIKKIIHEKDVNKIRETIRNNRKEQK